MSNIKTAITEAAIGQQAEGNMFTTMLDVGCEFESAGAYAFEAACRVEEDTWLEENFGSDPDAKWWGIYMKDGTVGRVNGQKGLDLVAHSKGLTLSGTSEWKYNKLLPSKYTSATCTIAGAMRKGISLAGKGKSELAAEIKTLKDTENNAVVDEYSAALKLADKLINKRPAITQAEWESIVTAIRSVS